MSHNPKRRLRRHIIRTLVEAQGRKFGVKRLVRGTPDWRRKGSKVVIAELQQKHSLSHGSE